MRNDRFTVDLPHDPDRLHALVMDAWRGSQSRPETAAPLDGADDLGARIARFARLATARHLALRVNGVERRIP
ncbi:MAG: hypothetical protein U0572_05415 [Phycisphaerales bacterium]